MNSETLLAYIAHNFYTQDCHERNHRPCRWAILDGMTKNQYLSKAMHAFHAWEEGEKYLDQVRLNKKVKERLGDPTELTPDDMDWVDAPKAIRLGDWMESERNDDDKDGPF